jgi:hypothetical protein
MKFLSFDEGTIFKGDLNGECFFIKSKGLPYLPKRYFYYERLQYQMPSLE